MPPDLPASWYPGGLGHHELRKEHGIYSRLHDNMEPSFVQSFAVPNPVKEPMIDCSQLETKGFTLAPPMFVAGWSWKVIVVAPVLRTTTASPTLGLH